ncbi:MAG TPA: asparagine synthase (glutamine-hydrolyzing) [Methylomirabilota bacterium]|nr:asparagine synthase (glutamine-hydrolyzing) [Methylomirabilota bacterium]
MCGVLGAVARSPGGRIDHAALAAMLPRLRHRGPDAGGAVAGAGFWLGHRRLSIIDLDDRANQPMADGTGAVWLTYNGEVYNFAEIRRTLGQLGHAFTTQSDTEVVLEAYCRWGIACLERFNGMFAFALYDTRTRELFLVRDRLGVKPLYYWVGPETVVFCSELKGVVDYPEVKRRLDLSAVSSFLSYRHPLGTATYFEGVCQLEPGTYLHVRDGRCRRQRYWSLRPGAGRAGGAEAHQRLRRLISASVRRMAVSDVPVAALLSGGLDSSIVVRELSRHVAGLTCFTAKLAEAEYDESAYAAEVARRCGVEHRLVPVDPRTHFELLPHLIRLKDQPLGMHNELAMYLLAREVGKHAKVVLCGEGADELFAGYGRIFRAPFDHRRARALQWLPGPLRRRALRRLGLTPADAGRSEVEFFLSRYTYFPAEEKLALFTDSMASAVEGDAAVREVIRGRFAELETGSFFDRIGLTFVTLHLPGLLLMVDATHMAASVEARVPFLDHEVVEAAFALPASDKLRWRSPLHLLAALLQPAAAFSEVHDRSKSVLRDVYAAELPPATLDRRKMGFPVPLAAWLTGPLGESVRRRLFHRETRLHALVDRRRLGQWYHDRCGAPSEAFGRQLWLLLNLELFLREYF